jgi:hypothetical protein
MAIAIAIETARVVRSPNCFPASTSKKFGQFWEKFGQFKKNINQSSTEAKKFEMKMEYCLCLCVFVITEVL